MNKQGFLKELKRKLKRLKKEERDKYIEYYDEIISDIVENGVSEEEAIERQGSIKQIAADIIVDPPFFNLKIRDWRGICLIAASTIMLFGCTIPLSWERKISASVGIIGGADGPPISLSREKAVLHGEYTL